MQYNDHHSFLHYAQQHHITNILIYLYNLQQLLLLYICLITLAKYSQRNPRTLRVRHVQSLFEIYFEKFIEIFLVLLLQLQEDHTNKIF